MNVKNNTNSQNKPKTKAALLKTRKTVLVSAVLILAALYALQVALGSRSPVKTFTFREKPDTITIQSSSQTVRLFYESGLWYVGEEKTAGDDAKIEELSDTLRNIKTLGTVSRSSAAQELDRYGFTDNQTLTVTAQKAGKPLRTLKIGKNSDTSLSSYIQLDEKAETLLSDKNLRSVFDVTEEDLKLKQEEPEPETDQAPGQKSSQEEGQSEEQKTIQSL
ncbi:MAG: hypothetical protein PUE30_08515 [Spirochaetia bacterium]|nr:hypothetical protein [Spirochaetia bacterium]